MPTFTEQKRLDAVVAYEESATLSREEIVLASGNNLLVGAVLGIVAGKYVEFDGAAATGAEVAAGILFADTDATAGDVTTVAIVRNAVVKTNGLTWKAGATGGHKTAATAALAAAGISIRADL